MNSQIKKILLKAELIEIEYQEVIDLFKQYNNQFIKDFAEELSFLNSLENKSKNETPHLSDPPTPASPITQKIYRNLAKKIHPDVSEAPSAEMDFKRLSSLQENDDLTGIISLASQHNIDLCNLTHEEIMFIKQKMTDKEKQIMQRHSTIAWMWGTSSMDESEKRKKVYEILKIDKKKFEEWKLEVAGIEPAS